MTLTTFTTGIGLRAEHYQEVLASLPPIPWLEVHSENYFSEGGLSLYYLNKIREHYPVSLHGVALSLGSTDPLDLGHLKKLKRLIDRMEPCFVSEHLCWSSINGHHYNELLPLPYTEESLAHVIDRVQQVQSYLQRTILVENICSYIQYPHSVIPEAEFLTALATRTGCKILLDINNLYINAKNHLFEPLHYLKIIPGDLIAEFHIAGHTVESIENKSILIDTHDQQVSAGVWHLYENALQLYGNRPTLIEWDSNLPRLSILTGEADKANQIIEKIYG